MPRALRGRDHGLKVAVLACALLSTVDPRAERLPVGSYTTSDGLPDDRVLRVVADEEGFVWLLTHGAVSRFDGGGFLVFGREHGFPAAFSFDLLDLGHEDHLIATSAGVYLLQGSSTNPSRVVEPLRCAEGAPPATAYTLFRDRAGRILAGGDMALHHLERSSGGWSCRALEIHPPPGHRFGVEEIVEDDRGALWLATKGAGLARLTPDGRTDWFGLDEGLPSVEVRGVEADRRGRIWVATMGGLCLLTPEPAPGRRAVARAFSEADGLTGYPPGGPPAPVIDVLETSDGTIWVATWSGLAVLETPRSDGAVPSDGGSRFRTFSAANGIIDRWPWRLTEDRQGDLWIATPTSGAHRLRRGGLTTFLAEDGLGDLGVYGLFEDRTGALCTANGVGGNRFVSCFDGRRFVTAAPLALARVGEHGWGWGQVTFQDSAGEWWFPTFEGLFRLPQRWSPRDLERAGPPIVYTTRDGLRSNLIFRLFEDAHRDVWIGVASTTETDVNPVHRWVRRTQSIDDCSDITGVPPDAVTAFAEDANGDLWVGFLTRGLGRIRGRSFVPFGADVGAPGGLIDQLYFDARGRLWIASRGDGLVRVDEPAAERPTFVRYTTNEGLRNDAIYCITEDRWGRLYLGHPLGVDRLDPATGHVRHYSTAEGLPVSSVLVARRDREGALWFGTSQGLSRLTPGLEPPAAAPPVWIQSVRVNGTQRDVPALGAARVADLELGPEERRIEIQFSGLGLALGERLRFQHRLETAMSGWSAPSADRKVDFASLSAGRYRFLVRAVNAEGLVSAEPAVVAFRIQPPFWRRWWFATGAALLVAAAGYGAHRVRLRRVVELERVRTRIATDLHDDIGSALSQVSILSEVARRHVAGADAAAAAPVLDQIAGVARELVDSMSDIVWAVNPRRDRATELVQRMRRFASDTCTGVGVALRFQAPREEQDRRLGIDLRRQVFLIFKEAVNNAVRHSRCSSAEIELRLEGRELTLRVTDDGVGFETARSSAGHGLTSMRARADAIGGQLTVDSAPGRGTTIRLRAPI